MRILFYTNELKNGDLRSDCIRQLADSLRDSAELTLVTRKDDCLAVLKENTPDIIHIHGCWDSHAASLARHVDRRTCAVVLSPHGELDAYVLRHEGRLAKQAKLAAYQRRLTHDSEALLVGSDDEAKHLTSKRWNRCVTVVRWGILDSTQTAEGLCDDAMAFYRKVIDTRYRLLMTDDEKEAVRSLLHVGKSRNETRSMLDSDKILTLRSLKPAQWRRIMLYAADEDIRGIVDDATARMQLSVPNIDTTTIDRFPTLRPKDMGPLERVKLIGHTVSKAKMKEVTANDSDELRTLATMMVNARTLTKQGTLSMRHVAELYEKVKYTDYDEDRFCEIMQELHLRKFMRKMIHVMQHDLYLEEGFMPDKPIKTDSLVK